MNRVRGVTLIINYEVDSCNKNNCYTNQQKLKKKQKKKKRGRTFAYSLTRLSTSMGR